MLSSFRKVNLAASIIQTVPGFSKTYFQMKRWLAPLHFWSVVNVDLTQDQGFGRCEIVPLVSCNKSILSHKKLLQFSGCKTEVELILARSACFQTPANIQEMTICPLHRARLGIGWRRSVRLCSIPKKLSGHSEDSKRNADRGPSLSQSQLIMEATGEFVPVGSGKSINLYL